MSLAPGVETIGELELIDYLKLVSGGDDSVMVIDSRVEQELKQGTIPGSVNVPYPRLDRDSVSPKAIAELLS